jgi:tRNA-2-methylthio-N6-dimethylallyladenosine synthase
MLKINKKVFSFIYSGMKRKAFCEKLKTQDISDKIKTIPDLKSFMNMTTSNEVNENSESLITSPHNLEENFLQKIPKTFFIETHGCQMNENDTEIISTILQSSNLTKSEKLEDAYVILTNTCAIRESAEEKVWNKIQHIKGIKRRDPEKIFGILGCMAERMKDKIFEKSNGVVDLIVGPDAYRDLPRMIDVISKKDENESRFAMNVQLSLEETYADILPVRKSGDNIRAYVSIMRGCNNMCSFCIVPFTRGRERSRNYNSIEDEVKMLRDIVSYFITY